jgi:streptogramin lyase
VRQASAGPWGLDIDNNGKVWFTETTDAVALIREYTKTGTLKEYKIRNGATAGSGLTPHLITVDPTGNVWWSEGWVSSIGRLTVAAAHRVRTAASPNTTTSQRAAPVGRTHPE